MYHNTPAPGIQAHLGAVKARNNLVFSWMYAWCCIHTSQPLGRKATIHQGTTMLATSKNVLFQGYNHLLTTGIDDPSLFLVLG